MFSIPKHGWVNLTIDNWTDRASYLTDIPEEILKASINFLKNPGLPASVSFDAEGWEYILVINHYDVYVIESKDEEKLYHFDKNGIKLIEEIYKDIYENLDAWACWSYDVNEEKFAIYKKRLEELLEELKNLLEKKKS